MAYYVILNFEDPDPKFGGVAPNRIAVENPGTKMKRSQALKDSGAAGPAAQATTHIYANRVGFSKKKDRDLVFYPCQEILSAQKNNTLSQVDLDAIQKDCAEAKTIAIFIHGDVIDTEHGFATGGVQICTWKDLGELMLLLLPATRENNIALLMCYGARSSNATLNHEGMIPSTELSTSFAYKLFRSICVHRQIRMSARTGLLRTDQGVNHLVECEESAMKQAMYQHALQQQRGVRKAEMDRLVTEVCEEHRLSREDFDAIVEEFAKNPAQMAWGEVQHVAKRYVIYSRHMEMYVKNSFKGQRTGDLEKYGKLVYTYKGGRLEIISRFDRDYTAKTYTLYEGQLLN